MKELQFSLTIDEYKIIKRALRYAVDTYDRLDDYPTGKTFFTVLRTLIDQRIDQIGESDAQKGITRTGAAWRVLDGTVDVGSSYAIITDNSTPIEILVSMNSGPVRDEADQVRLGDYAAWVEAKLNQH